VRNQHHCHGGGKTGRRSSNRTTDYGGKRNNRGGKGSKDRRKKARQEKTLQYNRMQMQRDGEACRAVDRALSILRDSEAARKCEQKKKSEQESVRKHEEHTHPSTFKLPSPNIINSTPERTTVLTTKLNETVVNTTIFDVLRQQLVTDNGIESNILKEVFEQEITYEESNFQYVLNDDENENDDYKELEKTCYSTYYRQNPDNNKRKFRTLKLQPVVNKYGFSQDNYYLTNYYNEQKEIEDKHQQDRLIEQKRNDATVRFEDNQAQARQNERETPNPVVEILRQTNEQQHNQRQINEDFVEKEVRKKRRITANC
jgi:hypothetical protein